MCVCAQIWCVHKYSLASPAVPGLTMAEGTQYLCKIKRIYSICKHRSVQISFS